MRIIHWLFIVSLALFLSGIGLVVAGARTARRAPVQATATVTTTPVASVKQIMKGIVEPAANAVFDAVQTSVTLKGVEEIAPHTDQEWEALGNSAAALIESGNLMLVSGRMVDKGDWVAMSRQMIDAGTLALRATQEKSPAKVLEAGLPLNKSCDNCHKKYQRGS